MNSTHEQPIGESQGHLRHLDESIAELRSMLARAGMPQADALLEQIQRDHDRLVELLEQIQRQPCVSAAEAVKRIDASRSALQTLGIELEKVMAAIFEHGEPSARRRRPRVATGPSRPRAERP